MTIEEKRKAIENKCNSYGLSCEKCELYGLKRVGHCYTNATNGEIERNYRLMFGNNYDNINHPKHYASGAHECIDIMVEMFGVQAVIDFCKCNIFKYRFRAAEKNGAEDIKKAEWYETKLIELNRRLENE